jgi:DNA polymerase-3 subunit delta
LRALGSELERLGSGGKEAIPVIRSLQRRLLMLAPIRARIERGERPQDVLASLGKSLFWKDKPVVEKLMATWDAGGLARAADRIGLLERNLMRGDSPPPAEALGEELIAIARAARRR